MGSHLRSSQQQNDQSSTTSPPGLSQDGFQQQYGNAAMQEALASGSPNASGRAAARGRSEHPKPRPLLATGRNRDRVDRVIRSGLAQERTQRREQTAASTYCATPASGLMKGEADLFVLTPTHDAHLRPSISSRQDRLL
jgi:hypothetical protein